MKSSLLIVIFMLITSFSPAQATTDGSETIELLGFSKKSQKIYFLIVNNDESGELPQLHYIHINYSGSPVKVKSIYKNLRTDDESQYDEFNERIENLKTKLVLVDKQDLKKIQLKTSVIKKSKKIILEDIEVPSWDLVFDIKASEFKGAGTLTSYCNPDVKVQDWIRVPDKDIAIAVISYSGIPYEDCYEKQDIVLLKAE